MSPGMRGRSRGELHSNHRLSTPPLLHYWVPYSVLNGEGSAFPAAYPWIIRSIHCKCFHFFPPGWEESYVAHPSTCPPRNCPGWSPVFQPGRSWIIHTSYSRGDSI